MMTPIWKSDYSKTKSFFCTRGDIGIGVLMLFTC